VAEESILRVCKVPRHPSHPQLVLVHS
jgi:hypothetical protein